MKFKTALAIILILLSIFGMWFWETNLREKIETTEVLVPAKDLKEGSIVTSLDFKTISINTDSKIDGSLKESDFKKIEGLICTANLKEKQQLLLEYFASSRDLKPSLKNHFVIPYSWIFEISSLAREGDYADIYGVPSKMYLGKYEIDIKGSDGLEIWAELDEYYKIYELVKDEGNSLLFVLEE